MMKRIGDMKGWAAFIVFTIGVILCCYVAFSPSPAKQRRSGYVYTAPAMSLDPNRDTCRWLDDDYDQCVQRRAERNAAKARQRAREMEQDDLNYHLRQRLQQEQYDDIMKGR